MISIITVTYNSAQTINDTIHSVFQQKYDNYEYIIIDGNSSDETVDIIKQSESLFCGKLKWISEPDNGLYDAINKGIKMASGDIVGIINSDDFYHKDNIFDIIEKTFSDDSIQAIYGDVRFINSNDLVKTVRYYSSRFFRPFLFRFGYMPAHPTFFTYKSNFEKYGYYKTDYKIAADYELLIRFIYINKIQTKYIQTDFLKMRVGGVSTQGLKSTLLLNNEIIRACKENGIWTCSILLYMRYFIKIFEKIFTKE